MRDAELARHLEEIDRLLWGVSSVDGPRNGLYTIRTSDMAHVWQAAGYVRAFLRDVRSQGRVMHKVDVQAMLDAAEKAADAERQKIRPEAYAYATKCGYLTAYLRELAANFNVLVEQFHRRGE